jgi:hypothetical protein
VLALALLTAEGGKEGGGREGKKEVEQGGVGVGCYSGEYLDPLEHIFQAGRQRLAESVVGITEKRHALAPHGY